MAIDAGACLAAGKCIVMTKNVYNIFVAIAILAGLFLLVLLLTGMFTPAMIFLKAKFMKGSLIYTVSRGQIGKFLISKSKHQGVADVKGVGPFIITENSHTIESKSKTPFYFAFGEFAATLPLEYAQLVQYMRESDEKVTNITDLAKFAQMKFDNEKKAWVSIKEEEMTKEDTAKTKELTALISPYKTIKIHDLAYMFPFNITPALIESKTQHMIGLKMHMFNKMNMQYVMMFIMILMGATLAAVIAYKFLKTGDVSTTETRTIVERVVQTAGVKNLTG